MKSSISKIVLVTVCALIFTLLLSTSCHRQPAADPTPDVPSPDVPEPSASPVAPSETPAVKPDDTPQPTPDADEPSDGITPVPPVTAPPVDTPDVNKPSIVTPPGSTAPYGARMDDEWFSDAAFLGNSLVDGFRLFSGLTTCDVYAATSMTVMGSGPLISQMAAEQYGKVYVLLGINEIGFEAEYFKKQYAAMLDDIIATQPNATIYVMSLTPVSQQKSSTDSTFTMDRVRLYNEKLLELVKEKGCYYIDLVEALADETGYLPANVTTDGVHFSASHYQVWLEYLRTHYVESIDDTAPPETNHGG